MADRIIKPDSGNDVVIQNNGGTRKMKVTNSGNIEFVGDLGFTGDTDSKIKLPSAGGIYESDGSTEILTESSGAVTLKNTAIDSSVTMSANQSAVKTAINASGSAPIYACRAWVNFNGNGDFSTNPGTAMIRDSGNVSSIGSTSTGQYTVNFTTAMAHANYSGSMYQNGSTNTGLTNFNNGFAGGFGSFTTTSCGVGTHHTSAYTNAEQILVCIFC